MYSLFDDYLLCFERRGRGCYGFRLDDPPGDDAEPASWKDEWAPAVQAGSLCYIAPAPFDRWGKDHRKQPLTSRHSGTLVGIDRFMSECRALTNMVALRPSH